MGMFAKKVAAAKPSDQSQSVYFHDGVYPLVQVTKLKLIDSQNPKDIGAQKFVIICDIIESNVSTRPAGMTGVSNTLNERHPGAADDCKRFLKAVFPDIVETEWDWKEGVKDEDQGINIVVGTMQPAAGRLVSLEVYTKVTEKAGVTKRFTKHMYTAVKPEVQAKAAEFRAKAGLPPLTA